MTITDLSVTIQSRTRRDQHGKDCPFAEVLYSFTQDGRPRNALTRLFHPLDNTAHARAIQAQDFLRRQERLT